MWRRVDIYFTAVLKQPAIFIKRLCVATYVLVLPLLLISFGACTDDGPSASLSEGVIVKPPCEGDACGLRDVSTIGVISGSAGGPPAGGPVEAPSVEEVLEKGRFLIGSSPVHIAIRGTTQSNSIRCDWKGLAMTTEQREAQIRFWLGTDDDEALPNAQEVEAEFMSHVNAMAPQYQDYVAASYLAIARGGLSTDLTILACYVDYFIGEYLLGAGPGVLTVAYDLLGEARSYDLYRRGREGGEFGPDPLMSEAEYETFLDGQVQNAESLLSQILEGRESVVFLAPMGAHNAIAVEAWQAVAQWDLQASKTSSVEGSDTSAVMAVRYGTYSADPEHTQTLDNLKRRIAAAATSDPYADSRIANVSGLTQYYRDIGAYGDITPDDGSTTTFTPAAPPPVKAR